MPGQDLTTIEKRRLEDEELKKAIPAGELAEWKRKGPPVPPEEPEEGVGAALEAADDLAEKIAKGAYQLHYFCKEKKKFSDAIINVDDNGVLSMAKVPKDKALRMAIYREMFRKVALDTGSSRIKFDFPLLKKNTDLGFDEVMSILNVALEEGKEILPGPKLIGWAASINEAQQKQYGDKLKELKMNHDDRLARMTGAAPAAAEPVPVEEPVPRARM